MLLCSIAAVYHAQGKHDDALTTWQDVLEVRVKILGLEHPDVASTSFNVSIVHKTLCQYELAVQCLQRCISIWSNEQDAKSTSMMTRAQRLLQECENALKYRYSPTALQPTACTSTRRSPAAHLPRFNKHLSLHLKNHTSHVRLICDSITGITQSPQATINLLCEALSEITVPAAYSSFGTLAGSTPGFSFGTSAGSTPGFSFGTMAGIPNLFGHLQAGTSSRSDS